MSQVANGLPKVTGTKPHIQPRATSDIAFLDTTANLSIEVPNSIQGIHIGTNGKGRLQLGSQASLTADTSATVTSIVGSASGNQEGGFVRLSRLEIGSNSASGTYHIHSGSLTVSRENGGNSLFMAQSGNGDGTFRITTGSLQTRAGVVLGSTAGGMGNFEVIGSHASAIESGSFGSLDGRWTQNLGSTLSVRIDKTTQGVTPIFIDGGGDVTFANGALLEMSISLPIFSMAAPSL